MRHPTSTRRFAKFRNNSTSWLVRTVKMTRLFQDLRFALRTYTRAPAFTLVAILVLGLGIGANSAIFTLVNVLLLQPLSGRAGELVGLYSRDKTKPDSYRAFSYPNYVDVRERAEVFDSLMAHTFTMVGLPAGDTTRRAFAAMVSSNYFETLGVGLAAGRPFSLEEERPGARIPVAIVSYARWKAEGNRPDFIGSTIRINALDVTVVGVTPEGFTGTMALLAPELYLPLGLYDVVVVDIFKNKATGLADRANPTLILAGRLRDGLDLTMAGARLETLSGEFERAYPAENRNQVLSISRLPRLSTSTSPQTNGPIAAVTAVFMALSGVVLLIASLNIANMLLARGTARRKEIALRLAVGASRGRVVRQLLTESVALAAGGAAAGLVFGYWAMRGLSGSLSAVMPLPIFFDPRPDVNVTLATSGFALVSTLLFGLGPALRLSRRDLVSDLKDVQGAASSSRRFFGARNLLVVAQIALSLALLTAGGLFARSTVAAQSSDPGYRYDRLLLASLDPALVGYQEGRVREVYRSLLERVRSLPGIEAAGMNSTVPFGDFQEGKTVERVGGRQASDAGASATYRIITADYFAALGLPLLRGREFTRQEEEFANAPGVAIIDEALAKQLFGQEEPIGQMVRIKPRPDGEDAHTTVPLQVVGIAGPIREDLLDRAPLPHLYVPHGRFHRGSMHLHARVAPGGSEAAVLADIRREIRNVDARLPVLALTTMQGFHDRSLQLWVMNAGGKMFTALGLLALTLAVVGVYGVKSYLVSQRTREIGIRMALGADRGAVLRLLLADGAKLTAVGLAVGLPLAGLISFALTKVMPAVTPFDPAVFAMAPLVLAAAALLASFVPARRAARVEPLRALRTE
jgi:predicted permease